MGSKGRLALKIIQLPHNKQVFIDDEDYQKISSYKWHTHTGGYAVTKIKNKSFYMHRLIMNAQKGIEIDHINSNKLDNQKKNLRIVSRSINMRNRFGHKDSSSQLLGVSFKKDKQKWQARIYVEGKHIHIGYFNNPLDAKLARIEFIKMHNLEGFKE